MPSPEEARTTRPRADRGPGADGSHGQGEPAAARVGTAAAEDGPARGYARMRARDDAVRAELEPLAPGERPLAIKLAVALAAGIGIGNLALAASGWQLNVAEQPDLFQSLALPVLMLVLAVAMWQRRYWALVLFQAILGISIIFAFLFLLRASNLEAVLLSGGVLAVSGALFWFLVRAMARVQMPGDASR